MTEQIKAALAQLDPTIDAHWTSDGSPRMDIIQHLSGDASITRKMVTDTDPTFTRKADEADEPTAAVEDAQEPMVEAEAPMPSEAPYEYDFEKMTTQEIFADEATLTAFQAHATDLINGWAAERKRLQNNIVNLSQVSARATIWLQRMRKDKTTGGDPSVVEYLSRQKKVRAAKAARAQALLDQGIDAKLLASQLSGKSTLDMALNQRKPARGSSRPDPRMPVKGQGGH